MTMRIRSCILLALLPIRSSSFQAPINSSNRAFSSRSSSSSSQKMVAADLIDTMSDVMSSALGRNVRLTSGRGGGASGGGGASTSAVVDTETDTKYFVKSAYGEYDMLNAEYEGVKAMAETETIRVPRPVCAGKEGAKAFVIFEYLEFTYGGSERELGIQLAKMHRNMSSNGKFGFHIDNTIGATHQPNGWVDSWTDFWDQHRLGHMLQLTDNAGYSDADVEKLREKTKELLSHNPEPSILHGDLWGGNKGYAKDADDKVVPVIFDPATYYGDREADIAMTYLFGGFGEDFYAGYNSEWPLPEGHEKRRTVYNLYHILNHEVLFSGYLGQARSMISQILRS